MSEREVYALGDRRELFVDDFFIAELSGDAVKRLHSPEPENTILTLDEPHEDSNNAGAFNSVLYDGKRYIYYYRAHGRFATPNVPDNSDYYLCAAESVDGVEFRRCRVNLFATGYNVVLDSSRTKHLVPEGEPDNCPAVSTAFYDTNPDCPENERYKLIVTNERKIYGMYLFVSADGFDFRQKAGPFQLSPRSGYDSANQAFFDHSIGQYRLYHRGFRIDGPTWKRTIMTHLTRDFVTFTDGSWLKFDPEFDALFARGQELYTNAIRPYFRAPHILLGFPMRYVEGCVKPGCHASGKYEEQIMRFAAGDPDAVPGAPDDVWDARVLSRPDLPARAFRAGKQLRYGTASTDTVLIASRDGFNFKGWGESFLRPGPESDSWFYGAGSLSIGMAQSPAKRGHGAPDELSFYGPEGSWGFVTARHRRYRLRMDGFVSLHFGIGGGTLLTPKFTFSGGRLTLNIATGALGGFRAELRDENGKPIPGYTFADAHEEIGDDLEMVARWRPHGPDVRPLAGKTVQLAISGSNCDIYSIRFAPWSPDPELPSL